MFIESVYAEDGLFLGLHLAEAMGRRIFRAEARGGKMGKFVFFLAVAMTIIATAAYGWVRAFQVAAPFTENNPWVVHGLFIGLIGMGISVIVFATAEYRQWRRFMDGIRNRG